jgi:chromosome segregation ATPase
MISLDNNLNKRFEEMFKEIEELRQSMLTLETQLQQSREKETVHSSRQSNIEVEYDALKDAFEQLKVESSTAQKNCVVSCNEKVYLLHEELRDCRMKISSLELLNQEVSQMNERLLIAEQEKISNSTLIKQLREEIEAYQRLNDSLKEKIRNMNSSDGKEFLDTFEEVMRSEMMTMKTAFESKLKAAREEADALSKKHLAEIARMKQSNLPTSLLQQKSLSDKQVVTTQK